MSNERQSKLNQFRYENPSKRDLLPNFIQHNYFFSILLKI